MPENINKGKQKRAPFRGAWLLVLTTVLVYLLDHPPVGIPALGRILDPINGCWANAEPFDEDFSGNVHFKGLHAATVWYDNRLVPHIHASSDHDLYFLQGYLHARFRLWQMDLETRAAAGRVSEVIGVKALDFDRKQRRKGMVYGAEQSLQMMEQQPETHAMLDAYTEGVNAYISGIRYRDYPIEYKLMGFCPEPWTNLKTALLLKFMADDLSGKTDDIALTYLRTTLPRDLLELIFPGRIAGSATVIPAGTPFDKPSMPIPAAPPDSVAFPRLKLSDLSDDHESGKGSNNWVLSGSRTANRAPILCNDPHLGLNLPSLWYEVQLQSPGNNVYGVSLPGAPGVIIGFNDSLTWGFTNNYRDVKDFYEISPVKGSSSKYWFAGKQLDFSERVEHIGIRGRADFIDTVRYTLHGPVMYDEHYHSADAFHKMLAVCWMAHRPSNELLAIYRLNRAHDYNAFVDAIMNFHCPAQNMAYADRRGNIAIWGQGLFVNKWKDQGRYVMNGTDSSTLWGPYIPMRENPHVLNPPQGYVASANECVTDTTYPYWYNGNFVELRAWRINQLLAGMQQATVTDMFKMQNDEYSVLASQALPVLLRHIPATFQVKKWNDLANALRQWDYLLLPESETATMFQVWWSFVMRDIWTPILGTHVPDNLLPLQERTMQLLQAGIDPARHVQVEGYYNDLANTSFHEMADSILKLEKTTGLEWYKVKHTSLTHLAKLPAFSFGDLKIGGWGNTINAVKSDHGPSWRMVVQMGRDIEAWGVYGGGQSGNPGSRYYATFIDHWVDGNYYRLRFLPNKDKQADAAIRYVWEVTGG